MADRNTADTLSFSLFGDQSVQTHDFIAHLHRQEHQRFLTKAFLAQAGNALRVEIEALPRLEREKLPKFQTLPQLNQRYHSQEQWHPGVDAALHCATQVGHYISRAETHPEDLTDPELSYLVGLCTGSFAAAAIASAPSVSDLVHVGVAATLLAFRTGRHVATLADRICSSADRTYTSKQTQSWTRILPNHTEEEAKHTISKFHSSHNLPRANELYISATSPQHICISGPPSTLSALLENRSDSKLALPFPVYGPYHAAHLHASTNVDSILRLDEPKIVDAFVNTKPRMPIISAATGSLLKAPDTAALFRLIVKEMLNEPVRFHKVVDFCIKDASSSQCSSVLVKPFGPTYNAATLASALKERTTLAHVSLRQDGGISPESSKSSIGNHGRTGKCKLAIVGMAGRFPDAESHDKLWELLARGLDVHREIPPDRFPVASHVDPTGKAINTSHTPYGCWIDKPGMFDPRFFNMSPREAFQTDPMQRMALTTAYEALEMSGYVPNRTPSTRLDRIGTFYGQTSDDWREINAAQEVDTYFITGGVRAFGPGRINYHFGFSGPSLNIDTACSSSAAAMNVACSALWTKDCDTAIVGGLSCMTNSDIFSGLSRGQFLSKKGPCATFDDGADGYCRGDSCASVIVKRLDDALADKDRVLAVILGTATNHSADAISITHPHGPTQSILSTAILDDAGVNPTDIDYVEMHGTGTQAGDGTEMLSVTNVFAPTGKNMRTRDRPLYLGAVKANVGHGEAASGVTALIKVLLMLQKNSIPPHVGIKNEINKGFPKDLSERNVNIAFHMTPFKRSDGQPRRVFINNFSAAGGNTGLLVEDGPEEPAAVTDPRGTHVLTLTGKSKTAMMRNAERLVDFLEEHPDTPLSHAAYTTTARRIQHYWRMNVAASDLSEARKAIQDRLNESFVPVSPEQPKVAFMFTGQGSHYAGLGKDLYAHYSVFRASINESEQIAKIHGLPSFMPLIDGSEQDVSKLSPTVVQLGLVCFEMALAKLWMSWGVRPSVVIGHSLGEYAALHVAGALSASDTIYLVGARAQLLLRKCTENTHAMLAVTGSVEAIKEALGRETSVNVACINGPRETVLSGAAAELTELVSQLQAAGFKSTMLKLPFAFHSAQVDPILDDFELLARSIEFQPAKVPVISPLLGKLLGDQIIDPAYLRNHAREAVNYLGGLVSAQQSGTIDEKTVWLEIGPHTTNANMVKTTFGVSTVTVPTLRRNEATYKTLSASLCTLHTAGLNIDWNEFHNDFSPSVLLLDLPSYSFDDKNYWLQYSGDWCLTKNRGAQSSAPPATIEPSKPKLETSSVHKITREEVNGDVAVVEIESDMCREDLRRVVGGHLVNGAPLCPSTLYADMAMTVSDYAYRLLRPKTKKIGTNVADVEVPKTLIFDDTAKSHILRLTVTANAALGHANLVFHTGEGARRVDHCTCKVVYGDTEGWSDEFERIAYLIRSRIDALMDGEKKGTASKIGRGLAYKLFSALVDYAPRYRGMEEVILDSDTCEATAKVTFQTTDQDGNFFFNPYWIDSMCHISGFIVNGSDAVDSRDQVFISHGWGSMKFVEKPVATKAYRSYIRMQPVKGSKMFAGDAYVFDGDRIIGVAGDVRFQSIPRKVLNLVLPPRGAAGAAAAPPPRPAPAAKSAHAHVPVKHAATKNKTLTKSGLATVNKKLASVVSQVLDILAREVGVGHDELADNIAFTDLGVDSLMALTVGGRLREELELDLSANAFVDYPTIGAFKGYLSQFESESSKGSSSSDSSSDSDGFQEMEHDSNVTTPLDESDMCSVKGDYNISTGDNDNLALLEVVRNTIAEEMRMDVDEIVAAPDLANLGVDSLMSLQILGTLRERTGLTIPADLFVTNPTLKDIERCLGVSEAPKLPPTTKRTKSASLVKQEQAGPVFTMSPIKLEAVPKANKTPRPKVFVDSYPHRKAESYLLQGIRTAARKLFLVPDGSGSATSYKEIPEIGRRNEWAVWGLVSPFLKTPEEYKCGVYGMATKFIETIKVRQPEGPYSLAGWSAGGVIAYEIMNQLIMAGDKVEHIIFIDAPCPITIEPLPKGLHAYFASIGLLGDGDASKVPSWLLPHFAASVTALSNYIAEPIPKDKCPKAMAIWCREGVCSGISPDKRPDPYPTGHALFLLDDRTDFGPNRWDEYLDIDKMVFRQMAGNHFSMMHGDLAKQLGGFIKEAVNM